MGKGASRFKGVESTIQPGLIGGMQSRRLFLTILAFGLTGGVSVAGDYNEKIVQRIASMPKGGVYAKYRKELPEDQRFDDLHQTVEDLEKAIGAGLGGRVKVEPAKAKGYSFCSSATYLLFCDVIGELQAEGMIPRNKALSREIADVGDKEAVIAGKMDGVGIFGHWNADGPGTAVLFQRLDLGTNLSSYEKARPGDFLKIFWNEHIGKGERGHLVVFLGESTDGNSIRVWSSQMENDDGTSGYGEMWVEKSRIRRALFSRLERPENLVNWLQFSPAEKKSDYLIRIRQTGSTGAEMKQVTGAAD